MGKGRKGGWKDGGGGEKGNMAVKISNPYMQASYSRVRI